MGFSELSIEGSDTTSDFYAHLQEAIKKGTTPNDLIRICEKEAIKDHGPYNTQGIINVALIIPALASHLKKSVHFLSFKQKVIEALETIMQNENTNRIVNRETQNQLNRIIQRVTRCY